MTLSNVEYIKQKITWFGNAQSIESSAKLYLIGIGFDHVFHCSDYNVVEKVRNVISLNENHVLFEILRSDKVGIPDLVVIKDGVVKFVEVKRISESYEDALSQKQIEWINRHPEFKVIILGFELDLKETQAIHEIEVLKDRISELEAKNKSLTMDLSFDYEKAEQLRGEILYNLKNLVDSIKYKQLAFDKNEERKP